MVNGNGDVHAIWNGSDGAVNEIKREIILLEFGCGRFGSLILLQIGEILI